MSQKLQPVRGTHDILPDEFRLHRHVVNTARTVGGLYGFEEMATPIFEFTDVFKRTLGDTSDVVNKEMYTFEDRGGESITLRPEFTAGIARAFISNGLQQNLPLKFFSTGPLFRYERPQKGRLRQFHQINFEWLGNAEPEADVELISLGYNILRNLGVSIGLKLELNSLGDSESRGRYREALVSYLGQFRGKLSEDSRNRLDKNPMRILDSKDQGDREIIKNAPVMSEYFSDYSKEFFNRVTNGLGAAGIDFNVNSRIVRGLDYYSHTVFEFIVESDDLGTQNTVLAGGRYDGLIKQMGGPDTPAVGFAAGIERLSLLVKDYSEENKASIAIVTINDGMEKEAIKIASMLRAKNIRTEVIYGGNMGKKMKKTDKIGARFAVIIGPEELNRGMVIVRNLVSGEQKEVANSEIVNFLSL